MTYDRGGRMTDQDDEIHNWVYDCTNQLTQFLLGDTLSWARMTGPQWESLSVDDWDTLPVDSAMQVTVDLAFDAAGNRQTRDEDSGTLTTYTYDAANRLTLAEDANGLTSYTYDANGNQLTIEEPSSDVTTYAWDFENQMIEVEDPSNVLTTYAYNADKLRVSREDDIETRKYVYDGTNVLLETVDAVTEAVDSLNPQEYGHLLSQHRDETSFYHYDGVQDTRSLSDSTETETDSYTFDPWGRETSSTGTTDNPFTYKPGSDCLENQVICVVWFHDFPSRIMTLRMVSSFLMQAMRATILGFPAATSRS